MSILSREGIEWIKHKTGEVDFLRLLVSDTKHDSPWDYWRPDVFHDVFASKVFKPLPPRAEVFSLLGDYFRTINRLFPLYHEASFMEWWNGSTHSRRAMTLLGGPASISFSPWPMNIDTQTVSSQKRTRKEHGSIIRTPYRFSLS